MRLVDERQAFTCNFIVIGAFQSPKFMEAKEVMECGNLELVDDILDRVAPILVELESVAKSKYGDHGFIWDYEVSEPLGEWLMEETVRSRHVESDAIRKKVTEICAALGIPFDERGEFTGNRRVVAKIMTQLDDGSYEYDMVQFDHPEANVWSIEAEYLQPDGLALWYVEGDIWDKALAIRLRDMM